MEQQTGEGDEVQARQHDRQPLVVAGQPPENAHSSSLTSVG